MKRAMLLAGILTLLALRADLRADEGDAPPILREVKLRQEKLNSQAPLDAEFRNERGQTVTLGDCMDGKTTILVLAYYRCPKVCTQVLNDLALGLRGVPSKLGDDYNIVTVSFDDRETPELAAAKKQSYVEMYGLPGTEKGWHFLTGRQQSILRLANAVGFQFRYDPKNDLFAHPTCITILTPEGKVSRYLLRLRDSSKPNEFSRDLRLGLAEASERKIGSEVTDTILLFCYRYDPETGNVAGRNTDLACAAGGLARR